MLLGAARDLIRHTVLVGPALVSTSTIPLPGWGVLWAGPEACGWSVPADLTVAIVVTLPAGVAGRGTAAVLRGRLYPGDELTGSTVVSTSRAGVHLFRLPQPPTGWHIGLEIDGQPGPGGLAVVTFGVWISALPTQEVTR
jgi:hypothetical protein